MTRFDLHVTFTRAHMNTLGLKVHQWQSGAFLSHADELAILKRLEVRCG